MRRDRVCVDQFDQTGLLVFGQIFFENQRGVNDVPVVVNIDLTQPGVVLPDD